MAGNYAQLLDIINNPTQHGLPAWDNNAKQIEGETIQQYLLYLIQSLTVGYQLMGVASTDTSGGTPDQNVFYLAGAGTYNGFGSNPITIDAGYIGIIRWNGAWSSDTIKIADVVSVLQNTETGGYDLNIGSDSYNVANTQETINQDLGIQLLPNTGRPNGSHQLSETLIVGHRYYVIIETNQSLTFDVKLQSEAGPDGHITQYIAPSVSRPAGVHYFTFVCSDDTARYLRIGTSSVWVGIDHQYFYTTLKDSIPLLSIEENTPSTGKTRLHLGNESCDVASADAVDEIDIINQKIVGYNDELKITTAGAFRIYGNFANQEKCKLIVDTTRTGTGSVVLYVYQGENLLKTITNSGIYDIVCVDDSNYITLVCNPNSGITSFTSLINCIRGIALKIFEEAPKQYMTKPKVWMPQNMFMLQNTKVEIFTNSVAESVNPNNYIMVLKNPDNSECGYNRGYKYEYQVGNNPDFHLQFGVRNEIVGEVYAENVTLMKHVTKKTSPLTNKNILCIGDSFTADGRYISEFKRLLTGIVTNGYSAPADCPITPDELTNLTFIGTKTTNIVPTEAVSGKSYNYFIGNQSPFWNPNANKIDFDYYCTQNDYSQIDFCIILLGTNGYATQEYVLPLWDALLEHNPNIKVIVMGMCFANPYGAGAGGILSDMNYLNLSDSTFITNRRLEEMTLLDDYKNNFLYVDYGCQIDIFNNMRFFEIQANQRNANAIVKSSTDLYDTIHPYTYSYYQIADALRAGFHYWCL